MNPKTKLFTMSLLAALLLAAFIVLPGCKKAPAVTDQGKETSKVEEPILQKTCPIMESNPINKELFTVYKGKKVYFCCPGCKPKFEANPEKYLSKLPQFEK